MIRQENRWVAVAKLLLQVEYPPSDFEIFDEWPTVSCPESMFRVLDRQTIRADFGICRRGSDPHALRDTRLVAVVEVGDLSSERKLTMWASHFSPEVRVIWMPKLDLLEAVNPGLNRFRFQLPPITRDIIFNELARQLGEISRAKQEAEALKRIVRQAVSEQVHALKRVSTMFKHLSFSMAAIADSLNPERWATILERIATDTGQSATTNTSGLSSEAEWEQLATTPSRIEERAREQRIYEVLRDTESK